ncbi:hypothetical protein EDD27_2519 [Nonomuraea polychroma]|uniref:Uncharacterized protein n=1 Tax=Nonomuraea polychroma TaxID=46176 RepID=A0A438M3T9_9ACTN|nr:hypothetical protein EDD27_2519 [Nonomuraea polychroma]
MTKLMDRVRKYLHSPKGQQTVEKAKRMARDPRHQARARNWLSKLRRH